MLDQDTTGAATPPLDEVEKPSLATSAASPPPEEPPLPVEESRAAEEPDVFNDSALRPGTEESFDSRSKKYYLEVAAGELTIGQGGGPINPESKAEQREKRDERFADDIERIERIMQQAEHARKWDSDVHEFAGVRATGREFYEMREFLKSEQGRKKVMDSLQAQGMTRDQAERATKKADELNDYIDRLRRNETLSEAEKKHMEELERDREVRAVTQNTERLYNKERGMEIKSENNLKGDITAAQTKDDYVFEIRQDGDSSLRQNAVRSIPANDHIISSATTSTVEARSFFPGAANLSKEFIRAQEAIEPLEREGPRNSPSPSSKPVATALARQEMTAIGLQL